MSRQLFCRNLISALLIILATPAFASMLDPESDKSSTINSPSSADDLKQKLDAARQSAGSAPITAAAPVPKAEPVVPTPQKPETIVTKTQEPIIHREVIQAGTIDTTQSQIFDTSANTPPLNVPAKSVDRQIIRMNEGSVAAAPPSDLHDLLFDDKPKSKAKAADSTAMPSVPIARVQDDYIPAPVPKAVSQASSANAMPPPALLPLPALSNDGNGAEQNTENAVIEKPEIAENKVAAVPQPVAKMPALVEIRKTPKPLPSTIQFKPTASKPRGNWGIRSLQKENTKGDNVCLLQNRFDNNLILVIGMNDKGQTLLAVNYGVDMLNSNQDYTPKVEIDDLYSKEVPAYANGPQRLMIQVDKDDEFLAALQSGNALHIALRGAGSTFSLDNMNDGLQDLSQCVHDLGGPPMPAPMAQHANTQAAGQIPMPPVPVVPVKDEAITPPPAPVAEQPSVPPVITPAEISPWPETTLAFLKKAGVTPIDVEKSDTEIQWNDRNKIMHAAARRLPAADLLDGSSLQLDKAEKECGGQFASQMGVPEKRGVSDVLQMESKCAVNGQVLVSTWVIAKDASGVTAWQMEAPRDNRGIAFDTRTQILDALAR